MYLLYFHSVIHLSKVLARVMVRAGMVVVTVWWTSVVDLSGGQGEVREEARA